MQYHSDHESRNSPLQFSDISVFDRLGQGRNGKCFM